VRTQWELMGGARRRLPARIENRSSVGRKLKLGPSRNVFLMPIGSRPFPMSPWTRSVTGTCRLGELISARWRGYGSHLLRTAPAVQTYASGDFNYLDQMAGAGIYDSDALLGTANLFKKLGGAAPSQFGTASHSRVKSLLDGSVAFRRSTRPAMLSSPILANQCHFRVSDGLENSATPYT
jgi:hypothetical protein